MAYYEIKFQGRDFINIDGAQFLNKLSYRDLMCEAHAGKIEAMSILDTVIFPVNHTELTALRFYHPEIITQNIDGYLYRLEAFDSPTKKETVVKIDGPVYTLGGFEFARFHDVQFQGKYNKRELIPHIKLCGSIYVALFATFKEAKKETFIAVRTA
jgi:hypothetical protein